MRSRLLLGAALAMLAGSGPTTAGAQTTGPGGCTAPALRGFGQDAGTAGIDAVRAWEAAVAVAGPAYRPSTRLAGLGAGARIGVCAVWADGATVTPGFGTEGGVLVRFVLPNSTDDDRLVYDPAAVHIELPRDWSSTPDPPWPVYPVPSDPVQLAMADRPWVLASLTRDATPVDVTAAVLLGSFTEQVGGPARPDRLVVADDCGRSAAEIVVARGVARVDDRITNVEPPGFLRTSPCSAAGAVVRSLLASRPSVAVGGDGMEVRQGATIATFRAAAAEDLDGTWRVESTSDEGPIAKARAPLLRLGTGVVAGSCAAAARYVAAAGHLAFGTQEVTDAPPQCDATDRAIVKRVVRLRSGSYTRSGDRLVLRTPDGTVVTFRRQPDPAARRLAGYVALTSTPLLEATLDPGTATEVVVAGKAGIPADASSVVLSVTARGLQASGSLVAWDCARGTPKAVSASFRVGADTTSTVISGIGTKGRVCLSSEQAARTAVDAVGYHAASAGFRAVTPTRILDSRASASNDALSGQRADWRFMRLTVAGRRSVPPDASAVALVVSTPAEVLDGHLTVYPCGNPPGTSSLNYTRGSTWSNLVVTALGPDRSVCVTRANDGAVVVDLVGYEQARSRFVRRDPARLLDTRFAQRTVDARDSGTGLLRTATAVELAVLGRGGVPPDAESVVLGLIADGARGDGTVTVWPCGTPMPSGPSLSFTKGVTTSGTVLAKVGAGGKVCLAPSVRTHLIADVSGAWMR